MSDPTGRAAVDVVVVGAGASGGVAALRLAQAGCSVVCLEQGGWPDRDAFPGAGPDPELAAGGPWSGDPNLRRAPADYPVDVADSDMHVVTYNGVGGGTVLYNAVWPRLTPTDFRSRTLRGIGDDWPLTYDELAPFYDRVDRQFGVSGLGGNPAYPPGADPPLPPLPIGAAGLRVARAHAGLGWHWWPDSNAILSRPYAGRHVCVQRGTCATGCNEGAKASTDLTHLAAAVAAGCRLVTGARATRVTVDARGRANGVEWVDEQGTMHHQPADVVLLAANGIGTPRLLLASATPAFPDGLVNSSGLVGRRLMMHPLVTVTGVFAEPLGTGHGHNGSAVQSMQFYASDETRGYVGHAKWSLHPTGGPLHAALTRPVWGERHVAHVRERLGRAAMWAVVCEDLPDPDRRVTLSGTLTDGSGLPAPRLHYRVDENTRRMADFHAERAAESLRAAGAVATETFPVWRNGHLMGTARMGDDPASSVVDRWGMAHDIPNLGVVDGSVFVTCGGVNPTATIAALALRAVEHLLDTRAALPRPDHSRPVAVSPMRVPVAAAGATDPAPLSPAERETLAGLAELVLAPPADLPGVREAAVATDGADAVLAVRPDLRGPLRAALAGAGTQPRAYLDRLRREDRTGYQALTTVAAAAYHRHPLVRRALAWTADQPVPVPAEDYPAYVAEGLLDHLLG